MQTYTIGTQPDPKDRTKIQVGEEDAAKIERLARESDEGVLVFDYIKKAHCCVARADCGLGCRCALKFVEPSGPLATALCENMPKKTPKRGKEIERGDVDRLREIIDEIKELAGEAKRIVRGTSEENRAGAYWYPHIIGALDREHDYLGGSMCTMEDSAGALADQVDEKD